jgi:hypothetical protein
MTGVGHSALPRARHMDPKASSTRDQPVGGGCVSGAERRFAGGGEFCGRRGRRDDFEGAIIFLKKDCPQVHVETL